jgi:hypothetical protein
MIMCRVILIIRQRVLLYNGRREGLLGYTSPVGRVAYLASLFVTVVHVAMT